MFQPVGRMDRWMRAGPEGVLTELHVDRLSCGRSVGRPADSSAVGGQPRVVLRVCVVGFG
jgi:hypothetical protein